MDSGTTKAAISSSRVKSSRSAGGSVEIDTYLLITSVLFFILDYLYIVPFINIFSKDHNSILAQSHKHDALSFIPSAGLIIMGFTVTMNFIGLVAHLSQLLKQRLELIPGDHIYAWRAFCTNSHHGIYIGSNKVIHFTKESFDRRKGCKSCAEFGEGNNGVICTCLDCFLRGGCLLRYEYGVSKLSLLFQIRGSRSCTIVSSDTESKVIYRAQDMLKSYRFGDCDLFKENCEDFALYCKSEHIFRYMFSPPEEMAASRRSTGMEHFFGRDRADIGGLYRAGLRVAPRRRTVHEWRRRRALRKWRRPLRKWTPGIVSKDIKSTFHQPKKRDALGVIPSAVLIIMEFIIIMHFIRWVAQLSQLLKRPLELIPGDHIYTWRAFCTYSHHGIYIGGNKVIHFTKESSDRRKVCKRCAEFGEGNNGVICTCLDCFLRGGCLRRYEYGVSKLSLLFQIRGRGSCTVASSDTENKVIYRAVSLFENGFGDYNLFRQNCEDFALYCKTEFINPVVTRGASGQIAAFCSAGMLLFVERYRADIGVRRDKMKVPVREISKFQCTFHSSYVLIAGTRKLFILGFECYWQFLVMMHRAGTGTNFRTEVLELLVYPLASFVLHFVAWSLYMEAKERTILYVTRFLYGSCTWN